MVPGIWGEGLYAIKMALLLFDSEEACRTSSLVIFVHGSWAGFTELLHWCELAYFSVSTSTPYLQRVASVELCRISPAVDKEPITYCKMNLHGIVLWYNNKHKLEKFEVWPCGWTIYRAAFAHMQSISSVHYIEFYYQQAADVWN